MNFLSSDWFSEANKAISTIEFDIDATIRNVVATDGSEVIYDLVFANNKVSYVTNPASEQDPDVQLSTSYDIAAKISQGLINPNEAFLKGEIKLGGNVAMLEETADKLAGLEDHLSDLRSRTSY